jgi:hypothetical protein
MISVWNEFPMKPHSGRLSNNIVPPRGVRLMCASTEGPLVQRQR